MNHTLWPMALAASMIAYGGGPATAHKSQEAAGDRQITNSIGMKLALIPSGNFEMGSGESAEKTAAYLGGIYSKAVNAGDLQDEYPPHGVLITRPFYLGACHVTRGQFRQFVADTGYRTDAEKAVKPGAVGWDAEKKHFAFDAKYSWRNTGFEQTDEHPVVNVSFNDATAFCRWLGRKEGKQYRLPSEAQWEYACRAGTSTRWWCGDDAEGLAQAANVADAAFKAKFPNTDCIKASDGYVFTSPVASFRANPLGLYDMHGNAWQWCADWYDAAYYDVSPPEDPDGPASGARRALRGGCFGPSDARSASRGRSPPDARLPNTGFRVTLTLPGSLARKSVQTPAVAAGQKQITVDLGHGVNLELVLIPAGEFLMGSGSSDKHADSREKPQHRVRIVRPFYLGKYSVTQQQGQAVMGSNPSHIKGSKNPVEQVSWDDCQEFLEKLNAKSVAPKGMRFQLPSETQWEYACRAGSTTTYCFGDSDDQRSDYAWVDRATAHPVGQKKPNTWGLYDMHGSMLEWCADFYDADYYGKSPTDEPAGPASGFFRVIRGGPSAWRYGTVPTGVGDSLGFRLALVRVEGQQR